MTTDTGWTGSDPAIEEFAFLARSHHRVSVLTRLSGEERTRRELHDATGISQPTLGRILGDFERRRWVSNGYDGSYTLTPLGSLLADAVADVLDALGTIDALADLAEHLPLDRLGFDLGHLSGATVTTPSSADPLAHMRRFDELAAHASAVRVFSNVLSCSPAHGSSDADRAFLAHVDELVVTHEGLETGLEDPALGAWLRDRIADGDISVYGYEGTADFLFGVFDGTVGIVPIDDAGVPCGLIESEAEPIHARVTDTFEEYRRTATRLTPGVLLD